MLDSETKKRIDNARDILVGKVPVPSSQVEQITIALIYKFMYDMDAESVELGGNPLYFTGDYAKYSWEKLFDPALGGDERINLYQEALDKIRENPDIPSLFRDVFKNAFLPYRDPNTLRLFLHCIDEFTYDHSERLGDAFEYLLAILGSQGDAGQFRTPRHIIDFIVALIDPQKDESILDPACGTAGFLISAYKHILKMNSSNYDPKNDKYTFEVSGTSLDELVINGKHYQGDKLVPSELERIHANIKGYDIAFEMVRLSVVNMFLHGFKTPKIHEYDTLSSEERWNELADIILANPPFMTPKGGITPHRRFSVKSTRSEVLFVDYMMEHLTANGRAGIIVPEGIIFQTANAYKQLRKTLVEDNYLVGVISLPAGVFNPYSGVKTSILWIDKRLAKKTDKIIFLKVENDGYNLGAQRRAINENDLPEILDFTETYKKAVLEGKEFECDDERVLVVEKNKIAENEEYSLSSTRYIMFDPVNMKFELSPLSSLCTIRTGKKNVNEGNPNGKYPFFTCAMNHTYSDSYSFDTEALLIAGNGAVGHVEYYEGKFEAYQRTYVLNEFSNVLPHYLYYVLKYSLSSYLDRIKLGNTMPYIKLSMLAEYQVPLPSLSIQEEIVKELDSYQKIIDGAKQVVDNWTPRIEIEPDWEKVKLGKICAFEYGKSLPLRDRIPGEYPVIGSNGVTGYHNESFVEGPVIVVGRKGSAGEVTWEDRDSNPIDTTFYIKHNPKFVDYKFLYYTLLSANLRDLRGGTGIPGLNRNDAYNVVVSLPDITTQREIVSRIEEEKTLVEHNLMIIDIFSDRIRIKVNSIWKNN